MALISSSTLIILISLFHILLAFLFLSSPRALVDPALVYLMGESMNMPDTHGFDAPSPAISFLAALLAFIGLSDVLSLSMPEEVSALYYWGMQAPFRLTVLMFTLIYTFTTNYLQRGSLPPSSSLAKFSTKRHNDAGGLDGLNNRVFFTFAFLEMVAWFLVWSTLRDEREGVVERLRRQKERERME